MMMTLQAQDVSVYFGTHHVLDTVNLKVTHHSRIGLVGVNGGGKSTLLKCLMGELEPTEGMVSKFPHFRVQCLTQNPKLTYGNTLQQELYSVFSEVLEAQQEEAHLLETLGTLTGKAYDDALHRLADLQELQQRHGADTLEAKISRMVTGLGFQLHELERPVEQFSGGWQMRINLAKVLLQGADVILMDEPTNHLDMEACQWLEQFLKEYPGGIVVVSHDREFLDKVVTEIAHIERGTLTLYSGNYTRFLEQREAERESQAAAAERQARYIAEQQAFVDRFRASATKSTQAKSREKQLAKIERIEAPEAELKRLSFQFPFPNPSGRDVLELKNVAKNFGEHTLYRNLSARVEWSKEAPQRIFLLGANGCGKTTLFKLLMGLEQPDAGNITFGHRVELGYYAQHQLQILDANKTAFETLQEAMPPTHDAEIRGILGRFLFTNDQVFKKVEVLSGGEKGRLAMARLMVSGPNVLLLDEPTNHLDIPAQEAVQSAMKEYQGTLFCISHDRYFIKSLATQIWEFDHGQLIVFEGTFEAYLEKRAVLLHQARKAAGVTVAPPVAMVASDGQLSKEAKRQTKQLQKQLKACEKQLDAVQKEKATLVEEMSHPRYRGDYLALDRMSQEVEGLEAKLKSTEAEWEAVACQLQALGVEI
ncbi:MAG: ABC-F family ATP-binding cassette domain-containing protein [Vampirovibrionales bacterium]